MVVVNCFCAFLRDSEFIVIHYKNTTGILYKIKRAQPENAQKESSCLFKCVRFGSIPEAGGKLGRMGGFGRKWNPGNAGESPNWLNRKKEMLEFVQYVKIEAAEQ